LTLGTNASGQRWSEVNGSTGQFNVVRLVNRAVPAQITGNTNNYAINGSGRALINSNGAYDITGIVAGQDGEVLWILNYGGSALTLKHNSGSSTAANRILSNTGADLVLAATFGTATLIYDVGSNFWYVMGV
jgi:hypothetical protein